MAVGGEKQGKERAARCESEPVVARAQDEVKDGCYGKRRHEKYEPRAGHAGCPDEPAGSEGAVNDGANEHGGRWHESTMPAPGAEIYALT